MSSIEIDANQILECYRAYMKFSVSQPPSRKQYLRNMEDKILDDEFLGDTKALLRPDEKYDPNAAWEMVRKVLIENI